MDLSVQDWLIVIGALLIAGVLLDAYRRYRNESRNPIRMGRKPGFWKLGDGFRAESETSNSELPNGGGRVRERAGDGARVEPRLDGGQQAPLVHAPEAPPESPPEARPTPPPLPASAGPAQAGEPRPPRDPAPARDDGDGEVLVIHVRARLTDGFAGEALAHLFQACDVRFGPLSVFQRHEEEKGMGAVQFSVANIVHPGTFADATLAEARLPGLSFILSLPGPQRPLEAFDCMLETARAVARNLDGEMQDESRSAFTSQTAEHCRQRIREYVHHNARSRG